MFATELPTLSQIRVWDVEHLIKAADSWTSTADQWDGVALQVWQDSHGLDWEGVARAALIQRTSADKATISGKADQLRESATVARRGASDIDAARRRVMYAVQDAQNAGFGVGEDLSVTDTRQSRTIAEQAERQAQAQAFAGDIRQRAAHLVGLDHEVSGNLATAATGVGNTTFNESPISGPDDRIVGDGAADRRYGVQLVDNTFKQDGPAPTPVTPTPPAPDLGQLRQQIQDQQRQINDIQNQLHQPSQPTLGGLGIAASTGCAGGALVASETGPGAIPACVVTGGLAGIGYLLGKIWE